MQLFKSAEDLNARVQAIKPELERLISEKRPAISKAVAAPFGLADELAKDFTDSSWLGEWDNADNY